MFCLALLLSSLAYSSDFQPPSSYRSVEFSASRDITSTLLVGGAWIYWQSTQFNSAPPTCHWCERDENGSDTLNFPDRWARNGLRWDSTNTADQLSNILAFGLVPAFTLGWGTLESRQWQDVAIILQAAVFAQVINQATKYAVARERPFVHAAATSKRMGISAQQEPNLSFYSGHSTWVFSLIAAAGTLAVKRDDPWAPWIWGLGGSLALTTSYLRVAADKHYAIDVLIGAMTGVWVGVGCVLLLHPLKKIDAPVSSGLPYLIPIGSPSDGVAGLGVKWDW